MMDSSIMNEHIDTLKKVLTGINSKYLFPCIKDLISSGMDSKHLSLVGQYGFSRQDITQYLAAWFKYIGVSQDDCQGWMIEYSVQVLSKISSSSYSRIRHSTKSNLKYIYKSDVAFDCGCENNVFKAFCSPKCPVYKEMLDKYKKTPPAPQIYEYRSTIKEVEPESFSLKERYREQFEKALETAIKHIGKGVSKKDVLILLNNRKFKTRTGRKWTYSILLNELRNYYNLSKE
jgi:hypothetical protein